MARKSRKNLPQSEQAAASVLLPELEEAKIPAAIYGRLSVEDEEKEESMETQIALVQDYIVEHQIKCTKKIKLNAKRNNVKFNSIQII